MGLFDRISKKDTYAKGSDEYILKEELEAEVEQLQGRLRDGHAELEGVLGKLEKVRAEYDEIVTNLMLVKKETNQKKMELDTLQKKFKTVRTDRPEGPVHAGGLADVSGAQAALSRTQQDLRQAASQLAKVRSESAREQEQLHSVRSQRIQVQKEMEAATARLYNARQDLSRIQHGRAADGTLDALSHDEKLLVSSGMSRSGGIIEAASAVVGSLKSKLSLAEEELEKTRQLLEKERQNHTETRNALDRLKKSRV